MTQKQRMEQGLIYDPTADEIMNEQTGEAQYLKEYNSLGLGNEKRIEELLRLMLAECGENCYLQPPFYANWGGAHLHLGNNVYANLIFEFGRYRFYSCELVRAYLYRRLHYDRAKCYYCNGRPSDFAVT